MRYTNASYKIPDKEGLITQCMIYCFVKNEYRDDESFISRQLFFCECDMFVKKNELKKSQECVTRNITCEKVRF